MNKNISSPETRPISFLNTLPVHASLELNSMQEAIRFSAETRFQHTLVGNGSQRHDSWALAQYGMAQYQQFSPLIAINPVWDHPVACARRMFSLTNLYGPRVALNVVSGAYHAEMNAVGDSLDAEGRQRRASEFCFVLGELLLHGRWEPREMEFFPYGEISLGLPTLPFTPELYISGAKGALASGSQVWQPRYVRNLRPLDQTEVSPAGTWGLRMGLCARESDDEAMSAVQSIFPENRAGQMLQATILLRQDSDWNLLLRSRMGAQQDPNYYLAPLLNGWVSAPYMVGSYAQLRRRIQAYRDRGYSFFLLDEAKNAEEAFHISRVVGELS